MYIHIYIIFFPLIISSTNDVMFYNKLLKEHFFLKIKKSWISYTNKSLSVAMERHMQIKKTETSSVKRSLFILHWFIRTLLWTTKTIQFAKLDSDSDDFDDYTSHLFWKTTRPIGKTRLDRISEYMHNWAWAPVHWEYRLDNSLGINFTVNKLYLSVNPLMRCSSKLSFIYLSNDYNDVQFTYCGIHSVIVLILPITNLRGSLVLQLYAKYDISMKYSVIDSKPKVNLFTVSNNPQIHRQYARSLPNGITVITYHMDMPVEIVDGVEEGEMWEEFEYTHYGYLPSHLKYFMRKTQYNVERIRNENTPIADVKHILIIPNGFAVVNFHIVVKRIEFITIRIRTFNDLGEIFDGPGILSPRIRQFIKNSSFVLYQSTTFQVVCFLQIGVVESLNFVFTSKKLNVKKLHVSTIQNIIFPQNSICNNYFVCILKLSSEPGTKLKVKIQHFTFRGPLSSECVFGGYFAYDQLPDKEIYNTHNCMTQDENYMHRNIYSETNNLILVFFHYKEYSRHIVMKLKVITTKCKRLSVNICKESSLNINLNTIQDCLVVQPYSSSLNQARCDTLLHPILEKTVKDKIVTTSFHLEGFLRTFHKKNKSRLGKLSK